MRIFVSILMVTCILGCQQLENTPSAQEIVDKAITISGGELHKTKNVSFRFRDKQYLSFVKDGKRSLQRSYMADTLEIKDIRSPKGALERYFNDSLIQLPDSVATRYANSVNSVHYFARLPHGLNDPAVQKKFLGEYTINNKPYYKVQVTFKEEDGGADFDDVYIYWFNKESFKPEFLAYEFHVNGGGVRFREAFNERYVNGIRFVDYNNYKPLDKTINVLQTDSLFLNKGLTLLSKIQLEDIKVY